jgi:hypothetical protein
MAADSHSISLETEISSREAKRSRATASPDGGLSTKKQKIIAPSPPRKYPKPTPRNGLGDTPSLICHPNGTMTIDNASVLELWASVVTQRTHPELLWETCLSAGNAIVRLVKGGITYHVDQHEDKVKADVRDGNPLVEVSQLDTMRFKLVLNANLVVLDGETPPGNEDTLKSKFTKPEDYKEMKKCLEITAALFAKDYLNERALNIFDSFRPTIEQGLDPWRTRTKFNCDVLFYLEYGAEDIRWVQQKAEEEEEEFEEQERLLALEKAAAKKAYKRTPPKPTPRRVTRAEAARVREISLNKAFISSLNPQPRRRGRGA